MPSDVDLQPGNGNELKRDCSVQLIKTHNLCGGCRINMFSMSSLLLFLMLFLIIFFSGGCE